MNAGNVSFKCVEGHGYPFSFFGDIETMVECPTCQGNLFLDNQFDDSSPEFFRTEHSFWEYMSHLLPPELTESRISLGEGKTPLIQSNLVTSNKTGGIYFKDESQNPTKSYRDRAAALLVAHALTLKVKSIFSASNGNMGAAISAYSARAGIAARIFSVRGLDVGKKSQILTYGGILFDGHADINKAIQVCLENQIKEDGYQGTAELNPISILAQKTISYEIVADGVIPDEIFISIGNGGTLFSIWQGFNDLLNLGIIEKVPRMIGARVVNDTKTKILPLLESQKFSQRDLLEYALKQSGGKIIDVSEKEIGIAVSNLARTEGFFVEPASAAAFAALSKHDGGKDLNQVVILTGTGLKAPIVIEAISNKDNFYTAAKFQKKMNLRLSILDQLNQAGELHGYGIYQGMKDMRSKQAVYQH
ncbi:MAG: pyridoxal-phosphate dependent enzyme, partial [Candidatus Hodarchaeota archaeon]